MVLAKIQPRIAAAAEDTFFMADRPAHGEPGEKPPIVLALADLIQDENGEVVLFNDSGLRSLGISTDAGVTAEGEVGYYVTAAGEDVTGFRYLTFDNGLKLFYQPGLDLILVYEPHALP